MDKSLFRSIVPYVVGLVIAMALYVYAGTIAYTPRAGSLGPEVWPRLAILLMGASCLFELSRRFIHNVCKARCQCRILTATFRN